MRATGEIPDAPNRRIAADGLKVSPALADTRDGSGHATRGGRLIGDKQRAHRNACPTGMPPDARRQDGTSGPEAIAGRKTPEIAPHQRQIGEIGGNRGSAVSPICDLEPNFQIQTVAEFSCECRPAADVPLMGGPGDGNARRGFRCPVFAASAVRFRRHSKTESAHVLIATWFLTGIRMSQ